MAKKGENIYKRKDGRYEGRYIKGRTLEGKPVYGSVYGKKYSEVKAKLMPLKAKYTMEPENGCHFTGTYSDWLEYWLEELEKPNVKMSTYANYYGIIHRHIQPWLGEVLLKRINRDQIQQLIHHLSEQAFSASFIQNVYRIINASIKKAVEMEMLDYNPCINILLPKKNKPKIGALTIREQKQLEDAAITSREGLAVLLALYTGMRIGEISALKWEDVDLQENLIYVRKTMQRIPSYMWETGKPSRNSKKTEVLFTEPKSQNSERFIPIAPRLTGQLLKWKEYNDSNYVISCKGGFTEPRLVGYHFRKIIQESGIRPIHFHALRHTFATRCMEKGVDVTTLSRLLGHASVKMTLDIYTDSLMDQRKAAIHKLENLF